MVVTPSWAGRHSGARPVWLGEVLDEDLTSEIADWVAAGGPGLAKPTSRWTCASSTQPSLSTVRVVLSLRTSAANAALMGFAPR